MAEDEAGADGDDAESVCGLSAPLGRLADALAKLTVFIESGALESSLREVMLVDDVRHAGRLLSAHEADVVEVIARLGRPAPLSRLGARQVSSLDRLQQAGFVVVEQRVVRVTERGRALATARTRRRGVSRRELGRLRDAFAKIAP